MLPGTASPPPTLAVLPFRNLTEDPEATAHLADGLAEALATNLAQTERLRVLPWVTTQRTRPDTVSLTRLAEALNARTLLIGTLRSTPQGLSVSLSLVDGRGGMQIWSRPFEGRADALPSLEAQMLFEAATALLGELTADERARMQMPSGRNGAAYSMYLEGAAHLRAGDPQSLAVAEQFFTRSLELDSTSAETHVGLAAVHNARAFMGLGATGPALDAAEVHFRRAYRLDSLSSIAMQGYSKLLNSKGHHREALAISKRALHARPRTLDNALVAARTFALNLPEVGLGICRDILREDPSNPAARFWAVIAAAFSGQSEEVLREGTEYLRRFGEEMEVYLWMALAAEKQGDTKRALTFARRAYEVAGDDADLRGLLVLAVVEETVLGHDSARDRCEQLQQLARERIARDQRATRARVLVQMAAAMLGDSTEVLRQWHSLRGTGHPAPGRPNWDPDYQLRFMLKIGRRDLAEQMAVALEKLAVGVEPPRRSLNSLEERLLAPDDDPLVARYLGQKFARHAALLAEFGTP